MTDATNNQTEISVPEAMEGLNYEKTQWYYVYQLLLDGKISPGRVNLNFQKYRQLQSEIVMLYKEYNSAFQRNTVVKGYRDDLKTLSKMTQHIFYQTEMTEDGAVTPAKLLLGDTYLYTPYENECARRMHLDILKYVANRMKQELLDFNQKGKLMVEEHQKKDRELRRVRACSRVECDICGREVSRSRLADHKKTGICRSHLNLTIER